MDGKIKGRSLHRGAPPSPSSKHNPRTVAASVESVLDAQSRHSFKVGLVCGEENRMVDQGTRRDIKVHRAKANLGGTEFTESVGCSLVEKHDGVRPELFKEPRQFSIAQDLATSHALLVDGGEPPPHLFFHGNDRNSQT